MPFDFTEFYYNIFLSKIISAVIILLVGLSLGRVIGKLIKRVLNEIDFNRITSKFIYINSEKAISKTASNIIYLATIFMALGTLEITGILWRGILIFLLVILLSDIALHLKDLLPNLYAYFKVKKSLHKNDIIKTELVDGKVKKIRLLSLKIESSNGDQIQIPNYSLLSGFSIKK